MLWPNVSRNAWSLQFEPISDHRDLGERPQVCLQVPLRSDGPDPGLTGAGQAPYSLSPRRCFWAPQKRVGTCAAWACVVAGSPELAQLCFSQAAVGRGQLCQGSREAGSPELQRGWVLGSHHRPQGCFVPGTRPTAGVQWVEGAGLCNHSWCDPHTSETNVGARQAWPGHPQGASGNARGHLLLALLALSAFWHSVPSPATAHPSR